VTYAAQFIFWTWPIENKILLQLCTALELKILINALNRSVGTNSELGYLNRLVK
jgi:hypothetical protein